VYSFNFSSSRQSQVMFASGSNTTDRGLNASRPVIILRGTRFARDREGKWFRTDWITGSRRGNWEDSICHSDKKDLRSLWMSLLTFPTVPSAQGEHAVVICCFICRIWLNSFITVSLRCHSWSPICIEGMRNLEYHCTRAQPPNDQLLWQKSTPRIPKNHALGPKRIQRGGC